MRGTLKQTNHSAGTIGSASVMESEWFWPLRPSTCSCRESLLNVVCGRLLRASAGTWEAKHAALRTNPDLSLHS
jgi:hypothetical protein